MLNDVVIGQYFPGNSLIHQLDPRTKIISLTIFIIAVFLANNYFLYSLLGLFILFNILLAKVSFKLIFKSLKPLWVVILFTALIHLFTTNGLVLWEFGTLTITKEGLQQAIFMSSRLTFLIIMSTILTLTTSPIALTDGIEKLLNPCKKVGLPVHELAMMMTIALRFIPTLLEETERIIKAQQARGADFSSGNIIKKAENIIPILVPLFISAFRRADELATAMEARCYRGGEGRTRMNELKVSLKDYIVISLMILGLIAIMYYNYVGVKYL